MNFIFTFVMNYFVKSCSLLKMKDSKSNLLILLHVISFVKGSMLLYFVNLLHLDYYYYNLGLNDLNLYYPIGSLIEFNLLVGFTINLTLYVYVLLLSYMPIYLLFNIKLPG